ncbi:TPA: hypothetical protein ACGOY6_001735, partial [Streptococcus suis]
FLLSITYSYKHANIFYFAPKIIYSIFSAIKSIISPIIKIDFFKKNSQTYFLPPPFPLVL